MAFKTVQEFNKERGYDNYFTLRNDGEFADVIILYRNIQDVLVADAHYIKSSNYSGYIHCCGRGCPACSKGISIRSKLFIPLFNITNNKIEFWDRNMFFENQLNQDVFNRYPNPSDFVFRITRHGVARDVNTSYEIRVVGKNDLYSYDAILAKFNTKVPDIYEMIIRDIPAVELTQMLNNQGDSANDTDVSYSNVNYKVTPRSEYTPSVIPESNPISTIDKIDDSANDADVDDGDVDDVVF